MKMDRRPYHLVLLLLALAMTVAGWDPVAALAADLIVGPGQTYTTIQAAVDAAASGDTIIIEAGTYTEQVFVDGKDLTLAGAGVGLTVIEAPSSLQVFDTNPVDQHPVVGVRSAEVAITDLSIDGARQGNLHEQFVGVLLRNAGGSLTDLTITGVRNEPLDAVNHGVGLALANDDGAARSLDVSGCQIDGFQKNAVSVTTAAGTTLDLALTGCVIVGAGPTAILVQNGIEVSGNDVVVDLQGNQIHDVAWLGVDHAATGILLSGCTGSVSGDNVLNGCQTGVHLNAAAVSVTDNRITVPRPTDFGFGVLIDNTDPDFGEGLTAPRPVPRPYIEARPVRTSRATLAIVVQDNVIDLDPAIDDPAGTIGIRAENRAGHDDLDVTVTGNTLTGFALATEAAETAPTDATWLAAQFGGNTFRACGAGLASNLPITVMAENCWWAAVDGPSGEGPGSGSTVSGDVDYEPWVTTYENLFCIPAELLVTEVATRDTTTFVYTGGASGRISGYSIDVVWDPTVTAATSADFSRPADGAFATASIFFVQDVEPGRVTVDAALGSSEPGIYEGALFAAAFGFVGTAPDSAEASVTVSINSLRDHLNEELGGLVHVPGLVRVDSKPVLQTILVTDTILGSSAWTRDGHDIAVTATVIESSLDSLRCDLAAFGGPVLEMVDATVDGNDYTWTWVGTSATGDGPVTAEITGVDSAGATGAGSGTIVADNTPPAALAEIVATPGHEKIHLVWTEPAPDAGSPVTGIELRQVAWGGYPGFSGSLPTPPADIGQGSDLDAGLQTGTTYTWAVASRDVYVVAGFVRDFVGNVSGAGASAAATSYWLGDTNGDGLVDVINDVTALANSYGLTAGDDGYDGVCDVGPTHDASPRGIPNPELDGYRIQFEDLMIFALNLGEVDPTLKFGPGDPPVLRWDRLGPTTWALVLQRPCAGLKGLNVQADLPAGVQCQLRPGALVEAQSAPIFLRDAGGDGLDAGLAAVGFGTVIIGQGELLRVELSESVAALDATISARDLGNHELLVSLPGGDGPPSPPPARHRLGQNYPNPFNPATTIHFELPQTERVRLAIYDINGRLVRMLVDGTRGAGEHAVTWLGRDQAGRPMAAGTYFCKLRAGDFSQVRKLTLVK